MPTVSIGPPTADDREAFLEAVARSKALHGQWISPPVTEAAFAEYLARISHDDHVGFFIRLIETDEIAGVVNISNIVREPLSSAFFGFYALEPCANQGYMKAGLRLVLERAFGELALHRLEANIQPTNPASIALVRACGFRQEGFSPKYLQIAGDWRDHERWALLADEVQLAEKFQLADS